MKAIIFDASTIISLALNGLLDILVKLKKNSKINFFITPQVKKEAIDRPKGSKRFELEALMIEDLLEHGILELANPDGLTKGTKDIMNLANIAFTFGKEKIKLIHEGEASCFALKKIWNKQDVALGIDERTARLISEKPNNLRRLLEIKLKKIISMDESKLDDYSGAIIIRSSEICLIAYKKGLIHLHTNPQKAIDALLNGVKFKGCSISNSEISKAKIMFRR